MYRRRYTPLASRHYGDVTDRNRKTHRLMEFRYLQMTLLSRGIQSLLEEVWEAIESSPDDKTLPILREALQLSQGVLHVDAKQLPSQLLSRIPVPFGELTSLLAQCNREGGVHILTRSRRPVLAPVGGRLINCIHVKPGLLDVITSLVMTSDGQRVITSTGQELAVVDVMKGVTQRIKTERVYDVTLLLCYDDSIVVMHSGKSLLAFSLEKEERIWIITDNIGYDTMTCCAGPRREILVVFHSDYVMLYDVITGNHTGTIRLPNSAEFKFCKKKTPPVANARYAVTTDKSCRLLVVVDVIDKAIVTFRSMQHLSPSSVVDGATGGDANGDGAGVDDAGDGNAKGKTDCCGSVEDQDEKEHDENDNQDSDEEQEEGDEEEEDNDDEEEEDSDDEDGEEEEEEDEDDEKEMMYESFTVDALCLCGVGYTVACLARESGHVYFLDITTLDTLSVFQGPEGRDDVITCQVTSDGRYMYYCTVADGKLSVWDLHNAKFGTVPIDCWMTEAVTSDGQIYVTSARTGQLKVWNVSRVSDTGQPGAQWSTALQDVTVLRVVDQGGVTAADCKTRWASIRDHFRKKYRESMTTTTGQASAKKRKWYLYDLLQFLIPSCSTGKTSSNLEIAYASASSGDEEQSQDSPLSMQSEESRPTHSASANFKKSCRRSSNGEVLKALKQPEQEIDENEYFFKSLLPILKNLDKVRALELRLEIHRLVLSYVKPAR